MELIEGQLKNIKQYQLDGITLPLGQLNGMKRVGAYICIAEIEPYSSNYKDERLFLLKKSFTKVTMKEGDSVAFQTSNNLRQLKFMDFFRSYPYICKTKSDIDNLLQLNERGLIISGANIEVYGARTKASIYIESVAWIIGIAALLYISFLIL